VVFSWLYAVAALSPALNLVPQLAPCAYHYLLWSLPAVLLIICVLARAAIARAPVPDQSRIGALSCLGAALFLAVLSWSRVPEFATKEMLFTKAVLKQPDAGINWSWYAAGLFATGVAADQAEAARAAVRALACEDSWRILPENRALVIILAALDLSRQGRSAEADALVEREVASLPADGGVIADIVRAQVALRSGQSARAVSLLMRFYPPLLQDAAGVLRTQCRSGLVLPDALPAQAEIASVLGGMDDAANRGHGIDNESRQLQALAYAYLIGGDVERAFDVAALTVNLVPGDRSARQLLGDIYRKLHLDAAAERLTGAPAAGVRSPPP
jgi:tetratricopeptide (TPR) repeat protein